MRESWGRSPRAITTTAPRSHSCRTFPLRPPLPLHTHVGALLAIPLLLAPYRPGCQRGKGRKKTHTRPPARPHSRTTLTNTQRGTHSHTRAHKPDTHAGSRARTRAHIRVRQRVQRSECAVTKGNRSGARRCTAGDVYLPALADKFTKLALQLLSRYTGWLASAFAARGAALEAPKGADGVPGPPGALGGPPASGATAPSTDEVSASVLAAAPPPMTQLCFDILPWTILR